MTFASSNLNGQYFSFHILRTQATGRNNCFMEVVENYASGSIPFYLQKLALNLQTSGSHSVGILRLQTQVTEFILFELRLLQFLVCTTDRSDPLFLYTELHIPLLPGKTHSFPSLSF
jgi:hypothetical protein